MSILLVTNCQTLFCSIAYAGYTPESGQGEGIRTLRILKPRPVGVGCPRGPRAGRALPGPESRATFASPLLRASSPATGRLPTPDHAARPRPRPACTRRCPGAQAPRAPCPRRAPPLAGAPPPGPSLGPRGQFALDPLRLGQWVVCLGVGSEIFLQSHVDDGAHVAPVPERQPVQLHVG